MNRSRTPLTILLIASFVVAGLARSWATGQREKLVPTPPGSAKMANFDSFSLALLLGGLRGPLVMFLWISSENQKVEKDMEGFDTKVEMIRLLQPQFASVHLYQIWNKAYNVSAMMASLPAKYVVILDALKYAREVERERPDDINIVLQIGQLYFDKLGNSAEKHYYGQRLRRESLPPREMVRIVFPTTRAVEFFQQARALGVDTSKAETAEDPASRTVKLVLPTESAAKIRQVFGGDGVEYRTIRPSNRQEAGQRPLWHNQLVGDDGMLLPELLKPRGSVAPPGNIGPDGLWNDGSELQYLARYNTPERGGFPYGVPPLALAYNYRQKGLAIQETSSQTHIHYSDSVVAALPATALKYWADEEIHRARRLEAMAMGQRPSPEPLEMELPTADVAVDAAFVDPSVVDEAIFGYRRCAQVSRDSTDSYDRFNASDLSTRFSYRSYRDALVAQEQVAMADAEYLQAMRATPSQRKDLLTAAATHYKAAMQGYYKVLLAYYTEDEVAFAVYKVPDKNGLIQQYTKLTIDKVDPDLYPQINKAAEDYIKTQRGGNDIHESDRGEYNTYILRAALRSKQIDTALGR